jgi:hypothetical protein
MAITLNDVLKLDEFKNCRILSGRGNMNNMVTTVSVIESPLDLSAIETIKTNTDFGQPGEFNISALYAYKDDLSKVIEIVDILVKEEASALCIIDSHVRSLPQNVMEYADKNNFPIIMISENVSYSNIISKIMGMVISDQKDMVTELRLKELMNSLDANESTREICKSINIKFKDNIFVAIIEIAEGINASPMLYWDFFKNKDTYSLIKYKDSLLAIFTFEEVITSMDSEIVDIIVERLESYGHTRRIALSSVKDRLELLPQAIKEADQTLKHANIYTDKVTYYDRLGLNQLLIPLRNNQSMIDFSHKILSTIEELDQPGDKSYMTTVESYIARDCNIKETAHSLGLHKNSIRYRLDKIKVLLNPQMSFDEFNAILIIAVKVRDLRK